MNEGASCIKIIESAKKIDQIFERLDEGYIEVKKVRTSWNATITSCSVVTRPKAAAGNEIGEQMIERWNNDPQPRWKHMSTGSSMHFLRLTV